MLGEKLPAEKAEQWGLIWKCVDDAQLDTEVNALAAKLALMPTRAIGGIKQAVRMAHTSTLDAALDLERDLQTEMGSSFDYNEGVQAFLAKRPARFEGR